MAVDEGVERKTILQWVGTLAIGICLPLLVYANQEGAKDQQIQQLINSVNDLKASQDENSKAIQGELNLLRQAITVESQKNSANTALLSRLESKLDNTANTVIRHGEMIAVLSSKQG